MTDTQAATETFLVPLNKLDADPKNVRKTYSKDGIAEMAATIRADGYRILQNIVVRKGEKRGRFFVTAGGRRLAALNLLAEAGEIAKDYPIECKERSGSDATEISLIENTSREAMHPVDEYEAFRVLADGGKPVEDIAARFGTTETMVRKRLALARVSPVLLNLYRNEEMSFQQLSAFTVSDDHAKQVEVWNSLPSWNRDSRSIKSALQSEAINANDKRIKFVGGIDVYETAGGAVKRDLFDEQNSGYALDVALVERLVVEKLEAEAEKLRADGWKWAECVSEFPQEAHYMSRVYPKDVPMTDEQQAELDRLEEENAEFADTGEVYDPDDLAKAGCYVLMDYHGRLSVERGLIRPEEEQDESAEGTDESSEPVPPRPETQPEPSFSLSAAFAQELTAQKTAAIRAELAHSPDVALATVVHAMLASLFHPYGSTDETCLEVKLTSEKLETSIKNPAACKGIVTMDDLRENYGHTIPGNPHDLWEWCLEQPTATLLDLLAYAAAKSVNALQLGHYERRKQRAHADRLAQALKIDMTQWFEPTAENYFGRVSKTGIEQALTEAKGADFAAGVSGMKKADAAAYAERQIAGTGWLPALLKIAPTADRAPEQGDEDQLDRDDCPFDLDDQPETENDQFPEAAE